MAIILGQKQVKDTAEFNDFAYGITLPIQISNVAFNQSFLSIDAIKTNIKNLLLTKKRERVMQPEFGSGLHEILFEFNDDDLADRIEDTITSAIETWLPYVTIEEILVEQDDTLKNQNRANISITFRANDNPNFENLTFTVN